MQKVTVTDPGGVTLHGPARARLSMDQWHAQGPQLGRWRRGGLVTLTRGEAITLSGGDVLLLDKAGKLPAGLAPVGGEAETGPPMAPEPKPKPERDTSATPDG